MDDQSSASADLGVVFLGAGRGSRLLPYTANRPKWLLPVRGRPILHYLTAIAHLAGITDVVLVRGMSRDDPGIPCIGVLDNPNAFNMVDSLFKAEAHFGTDFIMSYADILYERRIFAALCAADAEVAVVIDRDWLEYYGFRSSEPYYALAESLKLDGDRILEIGQPLTAHTEMPQGQYFGLARFKGAGAAALVSTYHELVDTHWGKPWRNAARFELAFMTDLLQELIERGVDVRAVFVDRGWVEFDTRDDYERVLAADQDGTLKRYIDLGTLPERPTVLSAGGVLWRRVRGELEVMVVAQGGPTDWRLPKGMQDRGERIRVTAEREVAEETGVLCSTGEYVGRSSWTYSFDGREWDETARFYLMDSIGGERDITDPQIVSANWMTVRAALDALKYEGEREVMRLAAAILTGRYPELRGVQ